MSQREKNKKKQNNGGKKHRSTGLTLTLSGALLALFQRRLEDLACILFAFVVGSVTVHARGAASEKESAWRFYFHLVRCRVFVFLSSR